MVHHGNAGAWIGRAHALLAVGVPPCLPASLQAFLAKKKEEERALAALRAQASQKGTFGGTGLKKSGKK